MTRPLEWVAAIRDHPGRPPSAQCHALTMLALRLDWMTGCGFASVGQLAADAAVSEPTVRRATKWARDAELLLCTRRGHRTAPGVVVASEWKLTQPITGDRLAEKPTDQNGKANRSIGPSQPLTTDPPSIPRTSRPRTSGAAPGARTRHARPAGAGQPRRAPPCPVCEDPFDSTRLADDDFYGLAKKSLVTHGDLECRTPACRAGDHDSCSVGSAVRCHCPCHDPAMANALPALAALLPGSQP